MFNEGRGKRLWMCFCVFIFFQKGSLASFAHLHLTVERVAVLRSVHRGRTAIVSKHVQADNDPFFIGRERLNSRAQVGKVAVVKDTPVEPVRYGHPSRGGAAVLL